MAAVGIALLVAGGIVVATGAVPLDAVAAEGSRVWPVLLFVAAITVVAELADAAGVFDAATDRAVRLLPRLRGLRRGSPATVSAEPPAASAWPLWGVVLVLSVLCTVFLSIDTTAILLTPVAVLLARRAGADPLPFALTTVWIANTGSLLLPVSNLTNLLAHSAGGGMSTGEFAALTWLPAVGGVVVPAAAIALFFHGRLSAPLVPAGSHEDSAPSDPAPSDSSGGGGPARRDRALLLVSATVVAVLLPLLVSGIPVWLSAVGAAAGLTVLFAVRRPDLLRPRLVPWPLLLFAAGLFLAAAVAHALGLSRLLAGLLGGGTDAPGPAALAAGGAVAANLANNLPAYLALEPVASGPAALVALLIGVNLGALVTPWASLATLLWRGRLRAAGLHLSWWRYAALGAVVAPVTVAVSWALLEVVTGGS